MPPNLLVSNHTHLMIPADDFEPGQLITAYRGPRTTYTFGALLGGGETVQEDRSYQGAVLQVLAVNLPYIVVKEIVSASGIPANGREKLSMAVDTRMYRFIRVTKEYTDALLQGFKSIHENIQNQPKAGLNLNNGTGSYITRYDHDADRKD